jgi:tetratricopeptide (TPR) repeat protein
MMRELYPRDITAYNYLRQIYTITGQPAKAEAVLRDALQYDDNRGNFYVNIADVLMIQGKKEEAKRYYQLYADTYPGHERSFRLLGNYYFEEGSYAEAEKNYDKSMLLSDGYTESMSKMALIRERQGKFDEAEELFAEAMQQASSANDSISVLQARMDFLQNQGRIREAIDAWDALLVAAKSVMPPINISISRITRTGWYFLIGQEDKVLQIIHSEEGAFNDSFKGILSFGYINYYLNVEDLPRAREEYEKVMAHTARFGSPGSIEKYYEAQIAVLEQDYEKALEKFLEFEQVSAFFQKDLLEIDIAKCYDELGRTKEAMGRLEEILQRHPYHALAHLKLAKILLESNNTSEVRKHLDTANKIWNVADADYMHAQEARRLRENI